MPVSTPKRSPRVLIAMTTSSMAVLPARSPMPFTVHSICRAPFCTAASELATAMPRSLWQWAPDDAVCPRDALAEPPEQRAVFLGERVPRRVGDVDRARAGLDHGREDLDHVIGVAARGVLGREFDVVEVLLRTRDRPHGGVEHVLPAHHELVLQMDVRGGNEDVDAGPLGALDGTDGTVDVLLAG